VVYYPKSNKRGEHYRGKFDRNSLEKFLVSYKFLDKFDGNDAASREKSAHKLEEEIVAYEEGHGHHLLERPHVEYTRGGGISISESFTMGPGETMDSMMSGF